MRSAVVAPLAAGLLLLLATPALADPPPPPLPSLPGALTADLSTAESTELATLTAGNGVQLDAVVQTPTGAMVVTLDAGSTAQAQQATALLDAQPSVAGAGLTRTVHAIGDTAGLGQISAQGSEYQWDLLKIDAQAARSLVSSSLPTVTVAVLDTGIAANLQLTPFLLPGRNFSTSDPADPTDTADRHFHGTHVAGTIGASVQTTGVEGVAAGVKLLPVKVLADDGTGFSSDIANGIIWAADHGADVINMSLGGQGDDPAMDSAIAYARGKGVVVVAAAGNDALNGNPVDYPGASPGVIAVAATDVNDVRASFSEYGPQVDVAAPGVDIESLYLTGGYATASGTSMAAPHVAAVAALVKAADRAFTPDQVQSLIDNSSVDLGPSGRDDWYGHGRVDALSAVDDALAAAGSAPPVTPIDLLYQRLGGSAGFLGQPTSAEHPVAGGTARTFATGEILQSPGSTSAHFVSGAIDARYEATGGPGSYLGFPVSDTACGLRNGGCWQHFQGGSIYWDPATGTHTISGSIRGTWWSLAGEAGRLGYPTSDTACGGAGCWQNFQGGTITQTAGRITTTYWR